MKHQFITLEDAEPANGNHYIRADHITALRPKWDADDNWLGTTVHTLDGSSRLVNCPVEDILALMEFEDAGEDSA